MTVFSTITTATAPLYEETVSLQSGIDWTPVAGLQSLACCIEPVQDAVGTRAMKLYPGVSQVIRLATYQPTIAKGMRAQAAGGQLYEVLQVANRAGEFTDLYVQALQFTG